VQTDGMDAADRVWWRCWLLTTVQPQVCNNSITPCVEVMPNLMGLLLVGHETVACWCGVDAANCSTTRTKYGFGSML